MTNISCCFTGHRELPAKDIASLREKLHRVISALVQKGYREFYTGGALGFDTVAAQCVLELKQENPEIRLHLIMPCANQTRGWSSEGIRLHGEIRAQADEVVCLSENYYSGCMQIRNRHLVEKCSVVVAYLTRTTGGSAYTVNYAKKKGLEIINIAEE